MANVILAITNPDGLIAGSDPYAPFAVAEIEVYRYATEAAARAQTGSTLVTTFTVVPSTTNPFTNDAGPWRYAYYDPDQTAYSWYRYRYSDGVSTFSLYSRPWKPAPMRSTLADLVFEVGQIAEEDVDRGTVKAGATSSNINIDCPTIFKSTLRDRRWWEGAHLFIESNVNGSATAPEMEEALIASVDTATGIATLDRPLTANVEAGDIFQVHPMAPVARIIRSINLVRERMFTLVNHDIAPETIAPTRNRYPAPPGVRSNADIISMRSILRSQGQPEHEDTWRTPYEVEFDGHSGWIVFHGGFNGATCRIRHEVSYRDLEGNLSLMSQYTLAPLEWLRKAAAWELFQWMDRSDQAATHFTQIAAVTAAELVTLSGRYAPSYQRDLNTGMKEPIGPAEVA